MARQPPRPKTTSPRRTAKAAGRRAPRPTTARRAGADTRAGLIDAALDVFGRLGYEGAGTREIAKAAGANLAAIVYHFGGKEGLHVAVAEHVAQAIMGHMGPALAAVRAPQARADAAAARAAIHRLLESFIDVILGEAEAERWARFIVREQMQPTAAFDVIYRILGGAADTATGLLAAAGGEAESEELRVRVFTMMGQVLVFRVAQTLVLRKLHWKSIGDRQRTLITRIVIEQIDAILEGVRT
jgi:AcrR family transcriptional regulator